MIDDKVKKIVEQARVDEKELQKFPAIVRALQKLEKRIIKLEQDKKTLDKLNSFCYTLVEEVVLRGRHSELFYSN